MASDALVAFDWRVFICHRAIHRAGENQSGNRSVVSTRIPREPRAKSGCDSQSLLYRLSFKQNSLAVVCERRADVVVSNRPCESWPQPPEFFLRNDQWFFLLLYIRKMARIIHRQNPHKAILTQFKSRDATVCTRDPYGL